MAGEGTTARDRGRTVLERPLGGRLRLLLGIPVPVVLIGSLLPPLARWLLDLSSGLPLRPLIRLVGAIDRPWEIAVNLAIWFAVAIGLAWARVQESARVTLTGAEVRVDRTDGSDTVPGADVSAVFLDGERLVILDRESRQPVRETLRVARPEVAAAFREYGYPWREADPHAELYRRWVSGTPDLPAAVDAVLAARQSALKKNSRPDARRLRQAVEQLGYAVREEGNQQYWRPLVPSSS
jgi:hypothetical protein